MKRLHLYIIILLLLFVSCSNNYEDFGEQTIVGVLSYTDFPYQRRGMWGLPVTNAPVVKTDIGEEYIYKIDQVDELCKSISRDTCVIIVPISDRYIDGIHYYGFIYEGDTIAITGRIYKRHYREKYTNYGHINEGDYYFIECQQSGIKLINRGVPYNEWVGEVRNKQNEENDKSVVFNWRFE